VPKLTNLPCLICRGYFLRENLVLVESNAKDRNRWKYLCRICITSAYERLTDALRARAVEISRDGSVKLIS
jgi:hypothetical protein